MRFLALGEFFVNIGRAILLLTFAKLLYDQTGQIWAFSLLFIVEMVSAFIIPMVAGGTVDLQGSRRVIRFTSAASIVVCAISSLLVLNIDTSTPLLLATSISLSIFNPFIKLSVFALTPKLSAHGHLEKNNGSLVFAFQGGQLLGIASAAWLLKACSLPTIFFIVAIVYFWACVSYFIATKGLAADIRDEPSTMGTGGGQGKNAEYKELARACFSFAPMLFLSNFDFSAVAIFNFLLAPIVAGNYENNPVWLAGLDASFAIGALIGGTFIVREMRKRGPNINSSLITQLLFLSCLTLYLLPPLKHVTPVLVMAFGAALSFSTVFWSVKLQKTFPMQFMGRLAGARNLLSSFYIGFITLAISSSHEVGLKAAVVVGAGITLFQLACLFLYAQRNTSLLPDRIGSA
jgi:MFS family permease